MWSSGEISYTTKSFATWLLLACVVFISVVPSAADSTGTSPFGLPRGGASKRVAGSGKEAFRLLATLFEEKFGDTSTEKLAKTLDRLASSQSAFKGLDGAAFEAYQRTHSSDDIDTAVAGRAQRSAARIAATAEALLACELVEAVENPNILEDDTLQGREVLLNITANDDTVKLGDSNLAILLLYEENYNGGAGLDHGTINSLTDGDDRNGPNKNKGRILVVLGDSLADDLVDTIAILDQKAAAGLAYPDPMPAC